ncbi:MAG: NAD(P)-binding protein [Desulfobulbaceae bacterium]|nr:NAD(P)-binding protein [Desulfobulbaceae bacterium]HIJ89379.1 NAD(P)-binding protein [Deltaproteobacteria bacterium]
MAKKTIKILGAGPAGLTAAIVLQKAGYQSQVHEKNGEVGRVFYGDLQGLENWSEERDVLDEFQALGLAINFDCTPFSALTVLNGEREWAFTSVRPGFYLIRRGAMPGSLDQGLKEQALAAGADILFNQPLSPPEADIIATGPLVRHRFAIDKGLVFKTSLPDAAYGLVNDRAACKGYAYLLFAKGYGCLCTVLFDNFSEVNRSLAETERIFRKFVDFDMEEPKTVGGLGGFLLDPVFEKEKQLLVGEAAGLQDMLWGFGIRSAVTSGALAAQSIITGKSYPLSARRLFLGKQKAGFVNRYLWETFGRNNYSHIMDRIDRCGDHGKFFHDFYNLNLLHHLAYPFAFHSLKKRYNLVAGDVR